MNTVGEIDLFLTEKCNLRCPYCYVEGKRNISGDIDSYKKFINMYFDKFATDSGRLLIVFFGGEPLIEFEMIKQIVAFANTLAEDKRRTLVFNIVTNGTLVTNDIIEFLKNNRVFIGVSFDGIKNIHDKHRVFHDGRGSYETVYGNLCSLVKSLPGRRIAVRITITPETVGAFSEGFLNVINSGVKVVLFGGTYEEHWSKETLTLFKSELKNVVKHWLDNVYNGNNIILQPVQSFVRHIADPKSAPFAHAHACDFRPAITVNGDIYPCHRFAATKGRKLCNIEDGADVMLDNYAVFLQELKEFRRRYHPHSGCAASSFKIYGDLKNANVNFRKFYEPFYSVAESVYNDVKGNRDLLNLIIHPPGIE